MYPPRRDALRAATPPLLLLPRSVRPPPPGARAATLNGMSKRAAPTAIPPAEPKRVCANAAGKADDKTGGQSAPNTVPNASYGLPSCSTSVAPPKCVSTQESSAGASGSATELQAGASCSTDASMPAPACPTEERTQTGSERCNAAASSSGSSLAAMDEPWMVSPALFPSKFMPSGITGMSPALVPSNAINIAVDRLESLDSHTNSDQHFFPLEAAAAHNSSEGADPSMFPEGGIMMLSDLQEKHASRATLSSAWRDYGVKLLVSDNTSSSQVLSAEEAALLRQLGADVRMEPRSELRLDSDPSVEASPVGALCISAADRSELSRLAEAGGFISPIAVSCGDATQLARLLGADIVQEGLPEPLRLDGDGDTYVKSETSNDDNGGHADVHADAAARATCYSSSMMPLTSSPRQTPRTKTEPTVTPQRSASALLGGPEGTRKPSWPPATPGSILAAATAASLSLHEVESADASDNAETADNADAVGHGRHGDNGDTAGSVCEHEAEELGSEPEIEDEAVRDAVKSEMLSSGLTQYVVAQQAGVSQPVLCTYLSGKHHKHSGKNARHLVKGKLILWLSGRSVELASCLPGIESILSSTSVTPCSEPQSVSQPISPLSLPVEPPLMAARQRSRGTKAADAKAADAKAADAKAADAKRVEAGARTIKARGGKAPPADAKTEENDGRIRPRGKGEGSSGEELTDGERSGAGSARRVRLTSQHLYVAYIWYLNQREHDGFAAGEEEHFCFKCKDGGDVMLCDFNGGECYKSYHARCCNLKAVPEGAWECPRHRCIRCGARQPKGEPAGKPRKPKDEGVQLWPCRTCPETYCTKCLPEECLHVGSEVVCGTCQHLLNSDFSLLQRDLINWDPDQFAAAAGHANWKLPGTTGSTA